MEGKSWEGLLKALASPAAQVAAGIALLWGIQKFFKEIGDVLHPSKKRAIWEWISGIRSTDKFERWPDTFASMFDRVFGENHLSWRCVWRSFVATTLIQTVCVLLWLTLQRKTFPAIVIVEPKFQIVAVLMAYAVWILLPNYLSLLKSRYALEWMQRRPSWGFLVGITILDTLLTLALAILQSTLWLAYLAQLAFGDYDLEKLVDQIPQSVLRLWVYYPAFFTSMWLWLYAASGFLLKAARQFDLGFVYLQRWFDIENKPLQAVGLVSGVLCAILYWLFAVGRAIVG